MRVEKKVSFMVNTGGWAKADVLVVLCLLCLLLMLLLLELLGVVLLLKEKQPEASMSMRSLTKQNRTIDFSRVASSKTQRFTVFR